MRPRSTAFFASSPAASSTLGFEVLVQEVIAAMSTSPWPRLAPFAAVTRLPSSAAGLAKPFSAMGLLKSSANFALRLASSMRSCGRFGPATEGLIDARSSLTVLV